MASFSPLSFSGESQTCYGLALVERMLRARGHSVLPFRPEGDETILWSCYWPEELYDLIRWRKKYGIERRPIVAGGNTATANPAAILPFVSACFLGDGEEWDGSEENAHIVTREKYPCAPAVAPNIIPMCFEDLQQHRRAFCEISRGCANRCLFCQYGWLKPYREADLADITAVIARSKTKSIRVFAADRFQHSHYLQIRKLMSKKGANDTGSDMSLRFILRKPEYMAFTKKVRVGIEGMSERLRRLVAKPASDDDICELARLVVAKGIRCFDWYMIYGLPTESDDDAEAFMNLLACLDPILKGMTLAIHWNAFQPNPLTPLQWSRCAYGYPTARMDRIFRFRCPSYKIMHEPKMTGDKRMALRMIAVRGSEAVSRLLYNAAVHPSWFYEHPDALCHAFEKEIGLSLVGSWPFDAPLPWDRYVKYDRAKLLSLAQRL